MILSVTLSTRKSKKIKVLLSCITDFTTKNARTSVRYLAASQPIKIIPCAIP